MGGQRVPHHHLPHLLLGLDHGVANGLRQRAGVAMNLKLVHAVLHVGGAVGMHACHRHRALLVQAQVGGQRGKVVLQLGRMGIDLGVGADPGDVDGGLPGAVFAGQRHPAPRLRQDASGQDHQSQGRATHAPPRGRIGLFRKRHDRRPLQISPDTPANRSETSPSPVGADA